MRAKQTDKKKRPVGRQKVYDCEVFPKKAEAMAASGLRDYQIAKGLSISVATFYVFINEYSEFSEAIKRGRKVADDAIENALYKRAKGYQVTETTVESKSTPAGQVESEKKTVKHIAPDVTAQIFWLKNRQPTLWKDKQDIEHSGTINNPFEDVMKNKSVEELESIVNKLADKSDN